MKKLALILPFIAGVSFAHAGHYEVSYSSPGDEVEIYGPLGGHWFDDYGGPNMYGWYGGGGVSSEPPPPGGGMTAVGPGSVTCSGPITATFTWTPDYVGDNEPPPKSAIVLQECIANWSGDYGACSNGLGDPEIPYGWGEPGGTSSGQAAFIKSNPGHSFSIPPVSPTATSTVTNPPSNSYLAAGASVSYRTTATPVRLNIAGALMNTSDWSYSCMVGHKLTASLDTGGFAQSNWAWPFPGQFFHHVEWGSKWWSNDFDQQYLYDSRKIKDHTPAQLGGSTFDLTYEYDVTGEAMGSADITFEGSVIGRAQGKRNLTVFMPYIYYAYNMLTVQWNGQQDPGSAVGGNSSQTPPWATSAIPGSAYFEGRMGEPPRFYDFTLTNGKWGFVQTLTRNQSFTYYPSGSSSDIFSDHRLDNTYPYGGRLVPPIGMMAPFDCEKSYWTLADSHSNSPGKKAWTWDAPSRGLNSVLTFTYGRNFRMMEVYFPASLGNGVEHIAVYEIEWSYSTSGGRSGGTPLPNWTSGNTGGTATITVTPHANCSRDLQWDAAITNSGGHGGAAGNGGPWGSPPVPGEPVYPGGGGGPGGPPGGPGGGLMALSAARVLGGLFQ